MPLDYLLDSHLGFTHCGDSGMNSSWRIGMSDVVTVWGGQVNGQCTVVAESLDTGTFPIHFSELPVCSELGTDIDTSWFQ